PAGDAPGHRRARHGARASSDRRPAAQGRADPAAGDRERRLQEPDHRRRLDPGQDGAGRADVRARRPASGLRLRQAQGLSGARASGRARQARRLARSPALVRTGPRPARALAPAAGGVPGRRRTWWRGDLKQSSLPARTLGNRSLRPLSMLSYQAVAHFPATSDPDRTLLTRQSLIESWPLTLPLP